MTKTLLFQLKSKSWKGNEHSMEGVSFHASGVNQSEIKSLVTTVHYANGTTTIKL